MKNVLLLVHDDKEQEARLRVALDVTRALSGHLTCVDVFTPPIIVSDYTGVAEMAVLAEASKHEGEILTALRDRLQKEDVSWDVLETCGDAGAEISNVAGLADLVVVTSHTDDPHGLNARRVAAELAAKSNRAVLAVPPGCDRLDVGGRVLIAWDGSPESADALRSALPLLQLAQDVTILEVARSEDHAPFEDAAAYLSRHGVHAGVVETITDRPIPDAILAHARAIGASYIVMGAFGHGRLVETVFGGVSHDMLQKSEFPLLLAH
jgi:nucleotide-binding universal stress UspA family protein